MKGVSRMVEKRTKEWCTCDQKRDGRYHAVWSERTKRMTMAIALVVGMLVWPTNTFAMTFLVSPMLPLLIYQGIGAPLENVAWSPDGKHLVSAGNDGITRVWDATTGRS